MEVVPDIMLVSLLNGELWAYEAAVDEFGPAVHAISAGHRLNAADREEVFQATFLSLLENRFKIRNPSSLPAWIAKVATNHCLRAKRRLETPHDPTIATVIDLTVETEADDSTADYSEAERRAVVEAISSLSERDVQMLHLLFAEHRYRYDDIAAMLELRPGSVGPMRGRILDRLRRHPAVHAMIGQRTSQSA